ncbi:MAG TPA: hypothetical protein VG474_12385, partial [Solirubrobacteraceae bacterium]|nr:hypothetical protein [Solirubrobacteraceae bacterium]
TTNAYDDGLYNFGARTMVDTTWGLFLGSANHATGTSVWRESGAGPCASAGAGSSSPPAPPQKLVTRASACGPSLSWQSSPGAASYSIRRSDYRPTGILPVLRPALPNGLRFDPIPSTAGLLLGNGMSAPSEPVSVGTTSSPSFVDRTAQTTAKYLYQVVAQGPSGLSPGSLVVANPGDPVTLVGVLGSTLAPVICG